MCHTCAAPLAPARGFRFAAEDDGAHHLAGAPDHDVSVAALPPVLERVTPRHPTGRTVYAHLRLEGGSVTFCGLAHTDWPPAPSDAAPCPNCAKGAPDAPAP